MERGASESARTINSAVVGDYVRQLRKLSSSLDSSIPEESLIPMALKMPDVFDTKTSELSEEDWEKLYCAIREAVSRLDEFRTTEGSSLRRDILGQVDKIESYVPQVEKYEKERIDTVRDRINSRMAELSFQPDENRMEQEMIFYLEKLDINEEKVRLRQHCTYFRETVDKEEYPGRKLGFIAQEMGREINTMGSKANHAEIQKWVVKMKDELEKIKEQSLNVL